MKGNENNIKKISWNEEWTKLFLFMYAYFSLLYNRDQRENNGRFINFKFLVEYIWKFFSNNNLSNIITCIN